MSAPSAPILFNNALLYFLDGTLDLNTNPFKVALLSNAYVPDVENHDVFAEISGELAAGNGYTAGGQALANPALIRTGGSVAFDADDTPFTGAGAGINGARYYLIYADATLNGKVKPLIAYGLMDSAPADVAIAAGNTVTIKWPAAGIAVFNKV